MQILFVLAIEAIIVIAVALGIGQVADRADHAKTQIQDVQK